MCSVQPQRVKEKDVNHQSIALLHLQGTLINVSFRALSSGLVQMDVSVLPASFTQFCKVSQHTWQTQNE